MNYTIDTNVIKKELELYKFRDKYYNNLDNNTLKLLNIKIEQDQGCFVD